MGMNTLANSKTTLLSFFSICAILVYVLSYQFTSNALAAGEICGFADSTTCYANDALCPSPEQCYVPAGTGSHPDEAGMNYLCNEPGGRCVRCIDNSYCTDPANPICRLPATVSSYCTTGCASNNDCASRQTRKVCGTRAQQCVVCNSNTDCAAPNPACINDGETTSACVQCETSGQCPSGQTCDTTQHRCTASATCRSPEETCGASAPSGLGGLGCCSATTFSCQWENGVGSIMRCLSSSATAPACTCDLPTQCSDPARYFCDTSARGRGLCRDNSADPISGLCVERPSEARIYKCTTGAGCTECPASSPDPFCFYNDLQSCNQGCAGLQEELETGRELEQSGEFPNLLDPTELIRTVATGVGILILIAAGFQAALGGYHLLTSEGDPQKIQMGHDELTSAVIGVIMGIIGIGFLQFVVRTFLG